MEKCQCCTEINSIEDLCPVCLQEYEEHLIQQFLDRDEFTIEDEFLKREA